MNLLKKKSGDPLKEIKGKKGKEKRDASTRDLLGIERLTAHGVITKDGDSLIFTLVKPCNLSVLSEESIRSHIHALTNVLKGVGDPELLCLSSREDFGSNKMFLSERIESEENLVIRKLLEWDLEFLDRIQVKMATAREFLIVHRFQGTIEAEIFPRLSHIEKAISDQGFKIKRAGPEDVKRILAVYFEQNLTTERFEDFDGERWVILGE